MTKWLGVCLLVCFVATVAPGQEVTSVNVVGYNKITMPPSTFVLVGMQFDAFDPVAKTQNAYYLSQSAGWVDMMTFEAATDILPVGEGFWYLARASFTWTEDNPYLANL